MTREEYFANLKQAEDALHYGVGKKDGGNTGSYDRKNTKTAAELYEEQQQRMREYEEGATAEYDERANKESYDAKQAAHDQRIADLQNEREKYADKWDDESIAKKREIHNQIMKEYDEASKETRAETARLKNETEMLVRTNKIKSKINKPIRAAVKITNKIFGPQITADIWNGLKNIVLKK